MSDAPERIVPSCVEALESYQQADMEGVMVFASRRAIHQTIDAYWARVKTCEELEAKLEKAVEGLRFYAEGEWLENYPGGVLYAAGDDTPEFKTHLDYGDKARTTLAELKGQDDE